MNEARVDPTSTTSRAMADEKPDRPSFAVVFMWLHDGGYFQEIAKSTSHGIFTRNQGGPREAPMGEQFPGFWLLGWDQAAHLCPEPKGGGVTCT